MAPRWTRRQPPLPLGARGIVSQSHEPVPGAVRRRTREDSRWRSEDARHRDRQGRRHPDPCPARQRWARGPASGLRAGHRARPVPRHQSDQHVRSLHQAVLADERRAIPRARPPRSGHRLRERSQRNEGDGRHRQHGAHRAADGGRAVPHGGAAAFPGAQLPPVRDEPAERRRERAARRADLGDGGRHDDRVLRGQVPLPVLAAVRAQSRWPTPMATPPPSRTPRGHPTSPRRITPSIRRRTPASRVRSASRSTAISARDRSASA